MFNKHLLEWTFSSLVVQTLIQFVELVIFECVQFWKLQRQFTRFFSYGTWFYSQVKNRLTFFSPIFKERFQLTLTQKGMSSMMKILHHSFISLSKYHNCISWFSDNPTHSHSAHRWRVKLTEGGNGMSPTSAEDLFLAVFHQELLITASFACFSVCEVCVPLNLSVNERFSLTHSCACV